MNEIREMEAGRELDALVAEKVMGWKWDNRNPLQSIMWLPGSETLGAVIFHDGDNDDGILQVRGIPPFSTDIAAAFEMVDYMCQNWHFGLSWTDNTEWGASFCKEPTDTGYIYFYKAYADARSLAICRAALLAMEDGE